MGWNKVTVDQYVKLRAVNENIKELEALEKTPDNNLEVLQAKCEKMALIFDKPVEYFENIPFIKLEESYKMALRIESEPLPQELKPVLKINGTTYNAITDPSKFNVCAYLAYQQYGKDIRGNMANILSWIYRVEGYDSTDEPGDHVPNMLQAKLTDVSGCFFLLLKRFRKWKAALPVFEEMAIMASTDHLQEALKWQKSQSSMDGSTQLNT